MRTAVQKFREELPSKGFVLSRIGGEIPEGGAQFGPRPPHLGEREVAPP